MLASNYLVERTAKELPKRRGPAQANQHIEPSHGNIGKQLARFPDDFLTRVGAAVVASILARAITANNAKHRQRQSKTMIQAKIMLQAIGTPEPSVRSYS